MAAADLLCFVGRLQSALKENLELLRKACPALCDVYPAKHAASGEWRYMAFYDSRSARAAECQFLKSLELSPGSGVDVPIVWCDKCGLLTRETAPEEVCIPEEDVRNINEFLDSDDLVELVTPDRGIQCVTGSGVRLKNGTAVPCVCIVFYVRAKGYLPLGCEPLPSHITWGDRAYAVDVRPGYYEHTMWEFLWMEERRAYPGVEIGVDTDTEAEQGAFSIGAHVKHTDTSALGVITAGHPFGVYPPSQGAAAASVLVQIPSRKESDESGGKSVRGAFTLRSSVVPVPGAPSNVDAAFLELCGCEAPPLHWDPLEILPAKWRARVERNHSFASAPLQGVLQITRSEHCVPLSDTELIPSGFVYKVGRTTGFTAGVLRQCRVVALSRGENLVDLVAEVHTPSSPPAILKDQLRVDNCRCGDSPVFVLPGDSGALVWTIVEEGGKRHAMALGIQSGCIFSAELNVVTPLGPALERLGLELVVEPH